MESNLEKMMLPFKLQQLLDIIIDKKGLNVEDSLQYLYASDLYKQMSSESSYLWQLSTNNLYELLKKEKREQKSKDNTSSPILLFIAFCIENYKNYKNISAEETLFLFKKYDVIDYLTDAYDVLHTQSPDYIMTEIDNYINNKSTDR